MARDKEKHQQAKASWYQTHKEITAKRSRIARQKIVDAVRELRKVPCYDCQEKYPWYVMEFDHRDGEKKFMDVSKMTGKYGLNRILKEIEKCDVVCANCHCVRTYKRREGLTI